LLPAIAAGAILAPISPVAAIIAVVPLAGIALAVVNALEGIFKMALYEHVAEDVQSEFFEQDVLTHAYTPGPAAFRGAR
ncbi:MAG TPA: hypothetical protein QGF05_09640, partial [Dehalococcoidia bacterium]|nr:hypothetical protein [Dehalococcoidia bacterium]